MTALASCLPVNICWLPRSIALATERQSVLGKYALNWADSPSTIVGNYQFRGALADGTAAC